MVMRVISKIPNTSSCCSGVRFFPLHNGAMVSEDISDQEIIDRFLVIPGFEVYEPTVRDPSGQEAPEVFPLGTKADGSGAGQDPQVPPAAASGPGVEANGQNSDAPPDSSGSPKNGESKKAKAKKAKAGK